LEMWGIRCWQRFLIAFSIQGEIGWLLGRVCILVRLCKIFLFNHRSGGGSCVSYWSADVGAVRKLPVMAFIASRWGLSRTPLPQRLRDIGAEAHRMPHVMAGDGPLSGHHKFSSHTNSASGRQKIAENHQKITLSSCIMTHLGHTASKQWYEVIRRKKLYRLQLFQIFPYCGCFTIAKKELAFFGLICNLCGRGPLVRLVRFPAVEHS